jgi:hypothetical protein
MYLRDYFETNPHNVIYTEVVGVGYGRPDIVVLNNGIVTVVEMKTTLSMKLIEQAFNWRYVANYVYIAIPKGSKPLNTFVTKILRDYGIGILQIDIQGSSTLKWYQEHNEKLNFCVRESLRPKLFRNKSRIDWKSKLKDMFKYENNVSGGNVGGGYNTPYKAMITEVKWYLKTHQDKPVAIKELIEYLDIVRSHYSNPKAGLYNALTTIESKDIVCETIGNKIYFSLTKEASEKY